MISLVTRALLFCAISLHLNAEQLPLIMERPFIDGKRDPFLQSIAPSKFTKIYTFDNEYSDDNINAQYTLAIHKEGLYVLIETNAQSLSYHKRGFLYGDGFKVMVGKANPFGRSKEYIELSYSPTNLKKDKKQEQYISSYNGSSLGKKLSSGASIAASETDSGTSFEAFIPWNDIHPYHPSTNRHVGINLYFAKGMKSLQGQYVTKGFAIKPDEGFWDEAITSRSLKSYKTEQTAQFRSTFSNSFYFDHHTVISGQSLMIRFPFKQSQKPKVFQILSQGGAQNTSQNTSPDTPQDNARNETYNGQPVYTFSGTPDPAGSVAFNTAAIPAGTYILRTRDRPGNFEQAFTVLPSTRLEPLLREVMENKSLSKGLEDTFRFQIKTIEDEILALKPYEPADHLQQKILKTASNIRSALSGKAVFSDGQKVYRRAFQSMLDGSLQPYSIKLPAHYSPSKQYPLLVFLHGSGQDEQRLLEKQRGNGEFIELAPLGRDQLNAYAFKHSKIDIDEAIADASRHYSIDNNKIVIGGFSMGGYGALKIFSESPDKYKGLAIFAGHPNLANLWLDSDQFPDFSKADSLSIFRDVPVFIYHGTADPALSYAPMQQLSLLLAEQGAHVSTSFVKGRGHLYQDENSHLKYSNWLLRVLKH
ncbi:alpha/beta hydrolase-fold protein [Pseudoteredinibacter isoporae]|uniref:Putative esterase n=1 Tax=Pseudoteredinibacter isoporae TaxID=570281 RepID=A0A7X0JVT7_9GAMM|nr:prolyl oligopeptidase family serine peptidase [Pseudoteredinibacter isoporae]MBB6523194.1 putative esterase [Pseudoteredinibacter isoporae]NHO88712.1 prolyl oligopeptidase family serine peptidase [Pseudoteredinibacter isoporae]NIB22597.1 prolyl oligopeptidase family serine peptidase [Pseudoteredinibacter isoporae]